MPTYTTPPRVSSRDMSQFSRLTARYVGQTLLYDGATWRLVENPTQETLAAAVKVYRGGYTYNLTTPEFNAIPSMYGGGGA